MENLKRSKGVALGLLDENKDIIEGIAEEKLVTNIRLRSPNDDVELSAPSTSRHESKRPAEYVKYGKITFNTTAILHHYPQMQDNVRSNNCIGREMTKKSDLNKPDEAKADNNNQTQSDINETKININKIKINDNNNDLIKSNCMKSKTLEVLRKPVKFTEEKLV
ncbi:unnamed protein product [Euphydryas editha]|uniref:Uncharacterized protein n=1 Tax=Euphydryas editha TaxID=104508 RepID=A0AAU9UGR3_EUPED|nr:unnamed protein product [Euphydryas editha]